VPHFLPEYGPTPRKLRQRIRAFCQYALRPVPFPAPQACTTTYLEETVRGVQRVTGMVSGCGLSWCRSRSGASPCARSGNTRKHESDCAPDHVSSRQVPTMYGARAGANDGRSLNAYSCSRRFDKCCALHRASIGDAALFSAGYPIGPAVTRGRPPVCPAAAGCHGAGRSARAHGASLTPPRQRRLPRPSIYVRHRPPKGR
jgi:hypothetical protein